MIKLKRPEDCSGCTACKSICPKDCISMEPDQEGFVYPVTDIDKCINCNACNRVCPVIKQEGKIVPSTFPAESKAFAAYIEDDEIRLGSSSGGIFTAIAEEIIKAGGVVYGAAWVDGVVRHVKAESLELLPQLRGSKYVQSSIGDVFREIRDLLRNGTKVLFSGTPCQVAGLKSFIGGDTENLILVEVACHGAPSPKALARYLEELRNNYGKDIKLDFRSKPDGDWKNYKVTAFKDQKHFFYENQKENVFMKGFLHELYSRPICHECPFKAGVSGADITLADFWGIENVLPKFSSYHGVSLVLTHNSEGESLFKTLNNIQNQEINLIDAIKCNGALIRSEDSHPERSYFFSRIDTGSFTKLVNRCLRFRTSTKVMLKLRSYIKKLK